MGFAEIAEVRVDPAAARVYEHGWQSWTPTTAYGLQQPAHRPSSGTRRVLCYRPDRVPPPIGFQGEGLLAVDPGDGGPVLVVATLDASVHMPSIRAEHRQGRVMVTADGPVERVEFEVPEPTTPAGPDPGGPGPGALGTGTGAPGDGGAGRLGRLGAALAAWADRYAERAAVPSPRPAPTVWCSWYHYFTRVTEGDMLENLDAMDELDLPVEVVQLDDGYQAEIGDWLELSGRFSSLHELVDRIRQRGRRAGIWVAPFLVGERSKLAAEHPDWLVRDATAGRNWDQELRALDVTHPDAAAWLGEVFTALAGMGIDYFKIDFVYAGALEGGRHGHADGLAAYRRGVQLIREAIGPDAYLLGCGAPILPSIGLVDAMRVSPDTAPVYEPPDADLSRPSQRAAVLTGRGRQWQHGRFWVNDPDCLLARPAVERREAWAAHVAEVGGLVASSDRLRDLDQWGLETTRRQLRAVTDVSRVIHEVRGQDGTPTER
ncbi:MAG TPA: glycoside hydrolase family 36 protein [Actinomycetes bacterium]